MITTLQDGVMGDGQPRELVQISIEQMESHCADLVELRTESNSSVTVMSDAAFNAFSEDQRRQIESLTGSILHLDLSSIERLGGRGVSEILAELH